MFLRHSRVKGCVPNVYFMHQWPRWKCDGNQPDDYSLRDKGEILYGIVMEYLEGCEPVSMKKASLRLAEIMGRTLEMIHVAGVVHGAITERNVLRCALLGSTFLVPCQAYST
jgi:hypothetical protein